MRNEVASKYSHALFKLAEEKDKLLEFKKSLAEFWQLVLDNDDLKEVLFHQQIMSDKKIRIIKEIFAEDSNQDILNFVLLLIERRREYYLESIIKEFNKLVDDAESILYVEVISAVKLDDSQLKKIKSKLNSILDYKIQIKNKTDEDIIAGLVLKVKDYLIDGSLHGELKKIQQRLKSIPVSKLGVN